MTPENIKLQVGQTWLTRGGSTNTLVEFDHSDELYPFKGDNNSWYTSAGRIYSSGQESISDLVELLSAPANDQPEPTQQFEYFPPALFAEWLQHAIEQYGTKPGIVAGVVAHKAAQHAADQELEACEEWLLQERIFSTDSDYLFQLRTARRPKTPSLAEQGCNALDAYIYGNPDHGDKQNTYNTIRAALDRLAELEASNE
jgi:hypothetical protein